MRKVMILMAFFVLSGCAVTSFVAYKIHPNYPRNKSKTLHIEGLHKPVKVLIDTFGVPHIQAQDTHDLVMAVGFFHGRDRFFEMDVLRRIASGRLSELVGLQHIRNGTSVDFDLSMRGWGMEDLAKQDVKAMSPGARALLKAYVAGVNAALKRYTPVEYRMLRVKPVPWHMRDSLVVGRLVTWSIAHNWTQEATRLILALYEGVDKARRIWPGRPWPGGVSLQPKGPLHPLPPAVMPELKGMFPGHKRTGKPAAAFALPFFSGASNAWAIGGGLSASGKPIVASDPHLLHMSPSFMYLEHLKWGKVDVIGAAVPGIPFVVAGHNRHVAWGITSTVADILDLCVEKTRQQHGVQQVLDPTGKWLNVARKTVVIRIRKRRRYIEKRFVIRHTANGPAFNDMYPGVLPKWAPLVTIRMPKIPIGDSLFALEAVAKAQTVMQLHEAFRNMAAPVNTYMAADTSGNIALFVAGKVPIRKGYRGTFPVPGWVKAYQWQGFIPYDDMPYGLSKGKAFFVNANNLSAAPGALKYIVNVDAAPDYRFERITELVKKTQKHTVKTNEAIQQDRYLMRARALMPVFLHDLDGMKTGDTGRKALNILKNWKYQAGPDMAAPAVFFAMYRSLLMHSIRMHLDPGPAHFVITRRYTPNFIDLALKDPENPLWDDPATPVHETRKQAVRRAFRQAVSFLSARLGPDVARWHWGRLHDIEIPHLFGAKRVLRKTFDMPRAAMGGGMDSVWKSHFDMADPEHPFRTTAGPVWRMVVDLNDINHGVWVLDTGESGWAGSPHYKDQFKRWIAGKYIPMWMNWQEIPKHLDGVWTLKPPKKEKK